MDDLSNVDLSSLITGSWIATVVSILLSIACIVACVYLAKQKGHDTVKAFTSGCVFGIFGVIYYLVVGESKGKPGGESKGRPREDAFIASVLANHAKEVGEDLPEPQLPVPPAPPIPVSLPVPLPVPLPPARCQYCGNVNPGDAEWCLGCGMKLRFDPTSSVTLDREALRRAGSGNLRNWLFLAIVAALVLALLVLLGTLIFKPSV